MKNVINKKVEQIIVATAFHNAVWNAVESRMSAIETSDITMKEKMVALIKTQYGDVLPSFEAFKTDRAALKKIALERGLKSDQHVRKPYNAAMLEVFGELPASDSTAAVQKRAQRAGSAGQGVDEGMDSESAGEAVKRSAMLMQMNVLGPRNPSEMFTIQQQITAWGIEKTLAALVDLLRADSDTKEAAKVLEKARIAVAA